MRIRRGIMPFSPRRRRGWKLPALIILVATILVRLLHAKIALVTQIWSVPPLHNIITLAADLPNNTDNNIIRSFCTLWNVQIDNWWTHHPTFELLQQNATHQCFRRIQNPQKAKLYQNLYDTQFTSTTNCNNDGNAAYTKLVTNSGWGIDVSHMVDGLLYAVENSVRVQLVARQPWQYADTAACAPGKDWNCYILPLSGACETVQYQRHADSSVVGQHLYEWRGFSALPVTRWLLEYCLRHQQWIRQRAVAMAETVQLATPCTAVHVRRADVVLHGKWSRKYHPIQEYINALTEQHPQHARNLLLLTDDANAVTEALQLLSSPSSAADDDYRWFYLQRTRHQGAAGGWENQIPSHDPVQEVVALAAAARLVQQCDSLVHSKSNLADYWYAVMQQGHQSSSAAAVRRIDLDATKSHDEIHRASNAETVRLSRNNDNSMG